MRGSFGTSLCVFPHLAMIKWLGRVLATNRIQSAFTGRDLGRHQGGHMVAKAGFRRHVTLGFRTRAFAICERLADFERSKP